MKKSNRNDHGLSARCLAFIAGLFAVANAGATPVLSEEYTAVSLEAVSGRKLKVEVVETKLRVVVGVGADLHQYEVPLKAVGPIDLEETIFGWDYTGRRRSIVVGTAIAADTGADIVLHKYRLYVSEGDFSCDASLYDPELNETTDWPCKVVQGVQVE